MDIKEASKEQYIKRAIDLQSKLDAALKDYIAAIDSGNSAKALGISERTLSYYIYNISQCQKMLKLIEGVKND